MCFSKEIITDKYYFSFSINWWWTRFLVGADWNFDKGFCDFDFLLGFMSIGFLYIRNKDY